MRIALVLFGAAVAIYAAAYAGALIELMMNTTSTMMLAS